MVTELAEGAPTPRRRAFHERTNDVRSGEREETTVQYARAPTLIFPRLEKDRAREAPSARL